MTREGVIPTKEEGRRMGAVVRAVEQRPWYQLFRKNRERRNRQNSTGAGTGTSSPCGCDFLSEGSVDCLGTADSPTTYVVDDLGPLGTNVELTFDASCEWISEDIDYDCSGS